MATDTTTQRLVWLDMTRFVGMFLIYYGHIVESVHQADIGAAHAQYKLVYSFHVVLFFVISGYLSRTDRPRIPHLKYLAVSRLVPVLFFSVISLPLHFATDSWVLGMAREEGIGEILMMYARGWPAFSFICWFLVALFVVELLHLIFGPQLSTIPRLTLAILLFGVVGWFVSERVEPFQDVWFAQEALMLYAWYLIGMLLRQTDALERIALDRWRNTVAFVICAAALYGTYDLNQPLHERPWGGTWDVVLINLSIHGNPLWFTLTTAAGCGAAFFLGRVLPPLAIAQHWGRNTLILMGLNSWFFDVVNGPLVALLPLAGNAPSVFAFCLVVTVGSLVACLPFIWIFNRYVPQLVGRPKVSGPLLPALS